MTNETTCADCGAPFPKPPAGGGPSGYAVTSVPRFPSPRFRYFTDAQGATATSATSAPEFPEWSAVYDVEGDDKRHALCEKLGNASAPMRRICYACAGVLDLETMTVRGATCLYLTREQRSVPPLSVAVAFAPRARQNSRNEPAAWWKLANWPGSASFRLLGSVRCSSGYGFGRRYPIQTFRFEGPDGYEWAGRCAGDMELARCKRTKVRLKRGAA